MALAVSNQASAIHFPAYATTHNAKHCPMNPKLPPDRHFGLLFTILFAVLAAISYFRGGHAYPWLLSLAAIVAAITLTRPQLLRPFNALWMRLAALLHRIVSPVVLAAIFFLILAPIGIVQRLTGRDALRRMFDPTATTYWIRRDPPGPPPESLRNQF